MKKSHQSKLEVVFIGNNLQKYNGIGQHIFQNVLHMYILFQWIKWSRYCTEHTTGDETVHVTGDIGRDGEHEPLRLLQAGRHVRFRSGDVGNRTTMCDRW